MTARKKLIEVALPLLSESDLRSWLNMPNDQLDRRTPIELLRSGKADAVADLAADMLSGNSD